MRQRRILSVLLTLSLVLGLLSPATALAASAEPASALDVLNAKQAEHEQAVEDAKADLAAYVSQSNSVRAQLDLLLAENAASLEEYERLTAELDIAMEQVDQSVRRYEEAQAAADEMQLLYESRITTLFKYRNRSLLEIFFASEDINGFFSNMRLMSYIASADQRMLQDLKIAQDDAAIARARASVIAEQAEVYFEYVDEQLFRLKEDIDLIETDLDSIEQQILNRSAGLNALELEGAHLNEELMAYYAEMARLQEEEAQRLAEAERTEAEREPEPADRVEDSEENSSIAAPTPKPGSDSSEQEDETEVSRTPAEPTPGANISQQGTNTSDTSRGTTTTGRTTTTERQTTTSTERQTTTSTERQTTTTARQTTTTTPSMTTTTERQTTTTTERQTTTTTTPPTTTAPPPTTTAPPPTTTTPPPTTQPPAASNVFMYPLASYQTVNSPYGPRVHPIGGYASFHYGSDFAAPAGTSIRAALSGTVILVDKRWNGQTYTSHLTGYGNYVTIQHANGLSTTYAHMRDVIVEVGQQIQQGEYIGTVGSTGASTGPHLHFEVAVYGSTVDPMGSNYLGNSSSIR